MVTRRQRLLLADDSITIQKVVSLTFVDEGMDVATAGDGEEAIRLLEENIPDIVLADVSMPRLSGYEVCEHIKGDERFRHIPVVLLVGSFEPYNEAEARRVGADDVVTKPFQSIRNLVNKVGSLLGGEPQADQNADTMDLAPYLSSPNETATSESDAAGQSTHVAHDPSASFADLDMDDALIEATPAERFGAARDASTAEAHASNAESDAVATASRDSANEDVPLVVMRPDYAVAESSTPDNLSDTFSTSSLHPMPAQRQDTQSFMSSPEELAHALEPMRAAQPAYATHGGTSSDDALLELDSHQASPSSVAVAEDDLILDLDDEVVPVVVEPEAAPPIDYAGAFAEAAHGDTSDAAPDATTHDFEISMPSSEFEMMEATPAVVPSSDINYAGDANEDVDIATPQEQTHAPESWNIDTGGVPQSAEAAATALAIEVGRDDAQAASLSTATHADTGNQTLAAAQVSPEIIDAIARRAVELLSERVVREIAWEVVPQLAELLIKRRLDEES